MFDSTIRLAGVATIGALVCLTSTADAAPQVINSGDTVGGWGVVFPAGITLTADNNPADSSITLNLNKTANFQSLEGLVIRFVQKENFASEQIAIRMESVSNNTGVTWDSFSFAVNDAKLGDGGTVQFKSAADTFTNLGPFTNSNFSNSMITLDGGFVTDGQTVTFGDDTGGPGSGGDLVILSRPSSPTGVPQVFDFKEIPSANGAPVIPLPAAAWSGMTALAGLGLIASKKRIKNFMM
jgi:hypothetical protein